MISGRTEATAYCLRLVTILSFVAVVKLEPDFALIDMKTFPYAGVSASSPPYTCTASAFAYKLLTRTL